MRKGLDKGETLGLMGEKDLVPIHNIFSNLEVVEPQEEVPSAYRRALKYLGDSNQLLRRLC